MSANCNINATNYNPVVNSSQFFSLEIAINNENLEALHNILDSEEFSRFPLTALKTSLKKAMQTNQFESIKALLNCNRSDELALESLDLLLTHPDRSFIGMIIESKAFNETSTEDLKKALQFLISANKLDIVKLILNTFRFYELREEIFHILERAAATNNVALFQIILECNMLEEIPEPTIRNCFATAETENNIEIIKLLLNSRKAADIPETIFMRFENIPETMSIEIGQALIDSRKFNRISRRSLQNSFLNAVNKDIPLVRCFLNSNRIDEISITTLRENSKQNNAIKHYLTFLMFHKNSLLQDSITYTKKKFLEQDDDSAIEIINCKNCNREPFLSNKTLIEILYDCIKDNRQLIVDAIISSGRIDKTYYVGLLRHALCLNKIEIINKFINSDPERSEKALLEIFESAISTNDIKLLKNLLSPTLTNFPSLNSSILITLQYAVTIPEFALIEVIMSSDKISQKDLAGLIFDAYENIISNPENNLPVMIFHKLLLHKDSLPILRSILNHYEEKQFFLLEAAIRKELCEITRELLNFPIFSREFLSLFFENEIVNNDEKLLNTLLSYPKFSTEDVLPILEKAIILGRTKIIKVCIKCDKISEKQTLKLFVDAVKTGRREILSILSSSNYILKENLIVALQKSLRDYDEEILKILLTYKNLSQQDIVEIVISLSEAKDPLSVRRLVFTGALEENSVKILKEKIKNQDSLDIVEEYSRISKEKSKPFNSSYFT